MHPILKELITELNQVATVILNMSSDDRALSLAHNNWSFPGIDRKELAAVATRLATKISEHGTDNLRNNESLLAQYPQRLQHLKNSTIPNLWGNASQGIPAYLITMESLERALAPVLVIDPDAIAADTKTAKALQIKIRGLSSRVADLEPKVETLQAMANQIVEAHSAADQLPTDLASLREAREEIQSLRDQAEKDSDAAKELLGKIDSCYETIKGHINSAEIEINKKSTEWDSFAKTTDEKAKEIFSRCEDAMRTSTSVGLASAFHEQAQSLKWSMLLWVLGLISALGAGTYFGGQQLHQLSEAIQASTPAMIIWTRLFISLLSVGAPVWFAWLATKQIGQRFRLAEDYAYKASISRAYEGYRREAVQLDSDFQTKLFSSALARLDEQPLRFVEHKTHGSPWHELLDSDVVKEAIKIAPELAGKITEMARDKVEEVKRSKVKPKAKPKAEPATEDHAGTQ